MEFKHKRGNGLILFDKITGIPLLIAAILVSFFTERNFDVQLVIPIILLALSPLFGVLKYLSTYYTIQDGHLIVETGILNKKRMEIPFREITTVDVSQNILYQLFNTYKIKVDNASQANDAADKAEIVLALKADQAFEFKRMITQNATFDIGKDENIDGITASFQDFIKLGLLQSKTMYFFTGGPIAVPIIGAVAALITGSKNSDELLDRVFGQAPIGIAVFGVVAFFFSISLGISLIRSIFTYYNFRISGDACTLKIAYGLFHKKKFTLQKNKISGILLKQNLLMRIFQCYTAEILVIGYGDKSDDEAYEQAIFYPIASAEKIRNITKELLPDFLPQSDVYRPDRKAMKYFFYRTGCIAAATTFMVCLLSKNIFLIVPAGILLVIAAISGMLQYLNTSISCGEDNIRLSFGGYHKTTAIIKTASIESITAKGSIFKRKKGIVSIRIGCIAPLRAANMTALNLPASQFTLLKNMIQY